MVEKTTICIHLAVIHARCAYGTFVSHATGKGAMHSDCHCAPIAVGGTRSVDAAALARSKIRREGSGAQEQAKGKKRQVFFLFFLAFALRFALSEYVRCR